MVQVQKKVYNVHTFMGPRKNPIVWEFLRDISLFNAAIFFHQQKAWSMEQWKKGSWLFVGYIGDEILPSYVGIIS